MDRPGLSPTRPMLKPNAPAPEGVIKFVLDFHPAESPDWMLCAELDAWRSLLFKLGLTGQDPKRYGGLAYGNVSRRLGGTAFLISGTQTGAWPELHAEHYCIVDACAVSENRITAHGPVQPSSEALTHAAVYRADARIQAVLHVHSPVLWTQAQALGLAITDPSAAYGTPAMADAVSRLVGTGEARIIAMGGHQDGLLACGASVTAAAMPLLHVLAQAVERAKAAAPGHQ